MKLINFNYCVGCDVLQWELSEKEDTYTVFFQLKFCVWSVIRNADENNEGEVVGDKKANDIHGHILTQAPFHTMYKSLIDHAWETKEHRDEVLSRHFPLPTTIH